jgi:hypothetical protein
MPNLNIPTPTTPNLKINSSLITPGNIDLKKRPKVRNPDGSYSTVYSHTFQVDENNPKSPWVNAPGVIKDKTGKYFKVPDGPKGEQMAREAYYRTKEHLGIHKTLKDAQAAAEQLHKDQETYYGK